MKKNEAIHTAIEITGQPVLWKAIYDRILAKQEEICAIIKSTLALSGKIILSGAGTSASIEGRIP